jgi:uncharacterized SAM-binding protein YcdF (DUF218 family)
LRKDSLIKFKKSIICLGAVFISAFLLWLIVLSVIFSKENNYSINNKTENNSLIVVLTGGKGRIDKGLKLLRANKGRYLLISGVFEERNIKNKYNITEYLGPNECCIFFEDKARNTIENAEQVELWIKKNEHSFNSIFLVTSYYHLPRSFLVFKKFFPNYDIIIVASENSLKVNKEIFFHIKLIFSEFFKVFYTLVLL